MEGCSADGFLPKSRGTKVVSESPTPGWEERLFSADYVAVSMRIPISLSAGSAASTLREVPFA